MNPRLVAIITGGSQGIGEGIVERYLGAGAQVINIDVKPGARPSGGDYHYYEADLSDPAATRAAGSEVAGRFEVNCIVNNAGVPYPGDLEDVTDEEFTKGV